MTAKVLISFLLSAISLTVFSQEPQNIVANIQAGGTIKIHQPAALDSLLSHRPETSANTPELGSAAAGGTEHSSPQSRSGYRVQIFEDNNPHTARRQAEAYNARMHSEFPHIRSYISFNSPYWRVKAGDFRNRAEAEAVLAELRQAFPSLAAYMRIVRDKINIFD